MPYALTDHLFLLPKNMYATQNNSFYNCTTGTFIGGGSYNLIHDNYYENVDTAQHFDNRGLFRIQCTPPCLAPS